VYENGAMKPVETVLRMGRRIRRTMDGVNLTKT
jgi:hypothetical protein